MLSVLCCAGYTILGSVLRFDNFVPRYLYVHTHTHTHTHIYIYIYACELSIYVHIPRMYYIYICTCVLICICTYTQTKHQTSTNAVAVEACFMRFLASYMLCLLDFARNFCARVPRCRLSVYRSIDLSIYLSIYLSRDIYIYILYEYPFASISFVLIILDNQTQ